jgi:DNA polymerase V
MIDPLILLSAKSCHLPLRGVAGAGFPSPAQDYAEEPIDLSAWLAPNRPSAFVMRVDGSSMVGAGIHAGDMVVVDKAKKPQSGSIVVAVAEGGFVIRQLAKRDGALVLRSVCDAPSFIQVNEDVELWGVVVSLARKF